MNLIAAPARQFKTWSMLLIMVGGLLNLTLGLVSALSTAKVIDATVFAVANAILLFAIGAVKFIRQTIAVTSDEKVDLVESAAAAPMKPGESNVAVKIDGASVPDSPKVGS